MNKKPKPPPGFRPLSNQTRSSRQRKSTLLHQNCRPDSLRLRFDLSKRRWQQEHSRQVTKTTTLDQTIKSQQQDISGLEQQVAHLKQQLRIKENQTTLGAASSFVNASSTSTHGAEPWREMVLLDALWDFPELIEDWDLVDKQTKSANHSTHVPLPRSDVMRAMENLVDDSLLHKLRNMSHEEWTTWCTQLQEAFACNRHLLTGFRKLVLATKTLSRAENLTQTVHQVAAQCQELIGAGQVSLCMIDPKTNELWTRQGELFKRWSIPHVPTPPTTKQQQASSTSTSNAETSKRCRFYQGTVFPSWAFGKGFASFVAATGCALDLPYQDLKKHYLYSSTRDGPGLINNGVTTLLCVPVMASRRRDDDNTMQAKQKQFNAQNPSANLRPIAVLQAFGKMVEYNVATSTNPSIIQTNESAIQTGMLMSRESFSQANRVLMALLTSHCCSALETAIDRDERSKNKCKEATLLGLARSIFTQLDLHKLGARFVEHGKSLLNADRCSVMLVRDEHLVSLSTDFDTSFRFPISSGVSGYVARTGLTLNIPDAYRSELFDRHMDRTSKYVTRTILCMAVRSEQRREGGEGGRETSKGASPLDSTQAQVNNNNTSTSPFDTSIEQKDDSSNESCGGTNEHQQPTRQERIRVCEPDGGGNVVAVVQMINKKGGIAFDEQDEEILRSLCNLVAISLENSRLFTETKHLCNDFASCTVQSNFEEGIPMIVSLAKRMLCVQSCTLMIIDRSYRELCCFSYVPNHMRESNDEPAYVKVTKHFSDLQDSMLQATVESKLTHVLGHLGKNKITTFDIEGTIVDLDIDVKHDVEAADSSSRMDSPRQFTNRETSRPMMRVGERSYQPRESVSRIEHVLCVPIFDKNGEVVAVLEAFNKLDSGQIKHNNNNDGTSTSAASPPQPTSPSLTSTSAISSFDAHAGPLSASIVVPFELDDIRIAHTLAIQLTGATSNIIESTERARQIKATAEIRAMASRLHGFCHPRGLMIRASEVCTDFLNADRTILFLTDPTSELMLWTLETVLNHNVAELTRQRGLFEESEAVVRRSVTEGFLAYVASQTEMCIATSGNDMIDNDPTFAAYHGLMASRVVNDKDELIGCVVVARRHRSFSRSEGQLFKLVFDHLEIATNTVFSVLPALAANRLLTDLSTYPQPVYQVTIDKLGHLSSCTHPIHGATTASHGVNERDGLRPNFDSSFEVTSILRGVRSNADIYSTPNTYVYDNYGNRLLVQLSTESSHTPLTQQSYHKWMNTAAPANGQQEGSRRVTASSTTRPSPSRSRATGFGARTTQRQNRADVPCKFATLRGLITSAFRDKRSTFVPCYSMADDRVDGPRHAFIQKQVSALPAQDNMNNSSSNNNNNTFAMNEERHGIHDNQRRVVDVDAKQEEEQTRQTDKILLRRLAVGMWRHVKDDDGRIDLRQIHRTFENAALHEYTAGISSSTTQNGVTESGAISGEAFRDALLDLGFVLQKSELDRLSVLFGVSPHEAPFGFVKYRECINRVAQGKYKEARAFALWVIPCINEDTHQVESVRLGLSPLDHDKTAFINSKEQ